MQKHTPRDHPDQGNLSTAIRELEAVTAEMNESVRQTEQRMKIFEVESRFLYPQPVLIAPARVFLDSAKMIKLSRNGLTE